jgi:hypothetical protein
MSSSLNVINNTTTIESHKIRCLFRACGIDIISVITEHSQPLTISLKHKYKDPILIDQPDFDIEEFMIGVDNGGKKLTSINIREYLENINKYVRLKFNPNTEIPREIKIISTSKGTSCELVCDNWIDMKKGPYNPLRNRGQYSKSSCNISC